MLSLGVSSFRLVPTCLIPSDSSIFITYSHASTIFLLFSSSSRQRHHLCNIFTGYITCIYVHMFFLIIQNYLDLLHDAALTCRDDVFVPMICWGGDDRWMDRIEQTDNRAHTQILITSKAGTQGANNSSMYYYKRNESIIIDKKLKEMNWLLVIIIIVIMRLIVCKSIHTNKNGQRGRKKRDICIFLFKSSGSSRVIISISNT